MFKKDSKKQGFTTFDTVMVLALGFTALGISASIMSESLRDDRMDRARFGAETLAHQIASGGLALGEPDAKNESPTQRGPAPVSQSEPGLGLYDGTLGKDPWGQPYHYKLIRGSDGRAARIFVWSDGADQKANTRLEDNDIALSGPIEKVEFSGDDVGFVYDL